MKRPGQEAPRLRVRLWFGELSELTLILSSSVCELVVAGKWAQGGAQVPAAWRQARSLSLATHLDLMGTALEGLGSQQIPGVLNGRSRVEQRLQT